MLEEYKGALIRSSIETRGDALQVYEHSILRCLLPTHCSNLCSEGTNLQQVDMHEWTMPAWQVFIDAGTKDSSLCRLDEDESHLTVARDKPICLLFAYRLFITLARYIISRAAPSPKKLLARKNLVFLIPHV